MPVPPEAAVGQLTLRHLNRLVEKYARPNRMLLSLLFPQSIHNAYAGDTIQVDELVGDRTMAPFTAIDGEAYELGDETGNAYTISAPNIFLSRPLTASRLMLQRQAGETNVFFSSPREQRMRANIRKKLLRDIARMESAIQERMEWMVAMGIRGEIQYKVANQANFTITYAKPAGNTMTASVFWNDATPANVRIRTDLDTIVKRKVSEQQAPAVNLALCGITVANAIRELVETKVLAFDLTNNVADGFFTWREQFSDMGAIYLGTINGIEFWEYANQVTDDISGTPEYLIRADYVEFFSRTRGTEDREMAYAEIQDFEAIQEGISIATRFTNSELKKNPSRYVQYMYARPVPIFYRPDHLFSLQATS